MCVYIYIYRERERERERYAGGGPLRPATPALPAGWICFFHGVPYFNQPVGRGPVLEKKNLALTPWFLFYFARCKGKNSRAENFVHEFCTAEPPPFLAKSRQSVFFVCFVIGGVYIYIYIYIYMGNFFFLPTWKRYFEVPNFKCLQKTRVFSNIKKDTGFVWFRSSFAWAHFLVWK